MAQGLRGLQTVTWKSWFTVDAEGYSKVFIIRELGQDGREELRIWRERETIEADWQRNLVGSSLKRRMCL